MIDLLDAGPGRRRCGWSGTDPLMVAYHDREWGMPEHDDRLLFEFLVLEGAQAGLSWSTILAKREGYRDRFARFDPAAVAAFGPGDVAAALADPGIVRNRLKVEAAVTNAAAFLTVAAEHGSFASYLWAQTGGTPRVNRWQALADIPPDTDLSRSLSSDLKRRGFRFVGPTIVYAYLQAVGVVNDHLVPCFRWSEVQGTG